MDEKIDRPVFELRSETERMRVKEQELRESGKVAEADELARRLARLEGEAKQIIARLKAMAAQSYNFDVTRNEQGLISRIVATPA